MRQGMHQTLHLLAIILSTLAVMMADETCSKERKEKHRHVIVVGGGLAGLSAAIEAVEAGVENVGV